MLCLGVAPIFAQSWIDVTDAYILNPTYDGNSYAYWEGTGLSGNGAKDNAEHYEKTFDTYQEIAGLKAGAKYRLSMNGFYRYGSSSQDYSTYQSGSYSQYQYAKLYANSGGNTTELALPLLGSGASDTNYGGGVVGLGGGWWGGAPYVPNNMEAAGLWFDNGYYRNSLTFTAGADGKATIGIKKSVWEGLDWVCIDNWKLEYYGNVVNVTSVRINNTTLSLVPTESAQLTASVLPEDATYKGVTWESTNENVAIVDATGMVTAVGTGSCFIRARSVQNSTIYGSCRVSVTENYGLPTNLVVNEIQASNIDMYRDPSFNYGSWIELYNPGSSAVPLAGLYVSDDTENLKKYQLPSTIGIVPARGYKVLWFDHHGIWNAGEHNQIDFKLDYDGGTIILSNGTQAYVQQDYPQAISRTSYARTTDGGSTWGVTASPTPGASNTASVFSSQQLAAPVVDKDAQIFAGTLQVCVNIPEGATLRYTTDGSTPTLSNGETSATGIFSINETTVCRFRLFKDGMIPSQVVTRSYLYNDKDFQLPIISVVGSYEDLYSNDYGVFVKGSKNGRPGAGQTSNCNWNMDWDRPVNFEYIAPETEGGEYTMMLNQEVDLARCGGWSRAWTPYSFKLKATKTYYGLNSLDCAFFPNKPFNKNKTLQIRNGGNDNYARFKDPALQQIVLRSGLYVDGQEWVPVLHYINGKFMGVINMREPNNKHFAYANYGIDTDEMDQFEMSPDSGYIQMEGTRDAFDRWYELSETAYDEASYEEICKLVDIDEYVNYLAVQFYLGGNDFPQNNVKGFRDRNDGRFHFVLFDLDAAFGSSDPFYDFTHKTMYTFDQLHGKFYDGTSIEGKRITKEIEFVTIFINMLQNEDFKKKFVDHFCVISGSVFEPTRCQEIISEMANRMASSMSISNGYGTSNPWGTANDLIGQLSSNRINNMVSKMASYVNPGTARQIVRLSSNVEGAGIMVNDMEVPTGKLNGYLYSPVKLKALAPSGYRFLGWTSNVATDVESTSLIKMGDAWNYFDGGSLDGQSWTSTNYNAKWGSGNTPIGYGKNQATTTEGYLPTYYFRKTVDLASAPSSKASFTLNYTIDDGCIVYVNGQEVGRYNMPSGSVYYNTFASSYAPNNPDTGTMSIDASYFKKGTNVIAVEVHNNSSTSSDILWDAELTMEESVTTTSEYYSEDPEIDLPYKATVTLVAMYEEIPDEEMMAAGTTPVKINEVSAANTIYVNEYFKKNDWIELYNTTSEPIDVAGMYISDNANKPTKYQIPASDISVNTIIPPHGYLVIWADKLEAKSQLHTTFKLDADGGCVLLTSADQKWSDKLSYPAHTGDKSVGLYPDGGTEVYVMTTPTINDKNMIGMYAELFLEPDIDDAIASVYEDPEELYGELMQEEYFTVSGAAMSKPVRGINLVKRTYASGKVITKKVFIR